MPLTDDQAKEIAIALDNNIDKFSASSREDKVLIVKHYLDAQIGSEPGAEIKSIPGVPMLSGELLEKISDIVLGAAASIIVDKKLLPGM